MSEKFNQNKVREDYQKASALNLTSTEAVALMNRKLGESSKESGLGLLDRMQIRGLKMLAQYGTWATGLVLAKLDSQVDGRAKELEAKLNELNEQVASIETRLERGAPEDDVEVLQADLLAAKTQLEDFTKEQLVYLFSDTELTDREQVVLEQAADGLRTLMEPSIPDMRYQDLTPDEREYLSLKNEAETKRAYAELVAKTSSHSSKNDPSVASSVREASNTAAYAEIDRNEFLRTHPGIEAAIAIKKKGRNA
jgi:hypothetical protein